MRSAPRMMQHGLVDRVYSSSFTTLVLAGISLGHGPAQIDTFAGLQQKHIPVCVVQTATPPYILVVSAGKHLQYNRIRDPGASPGVIVFRDARPAASTDWPPDPTVGHSYTKRTQANNTCPESYRSASI